MSVSAEMWYTGYDPYTLEPVFSAKTPREKLAQRMFFFWYKPEERRNIEQELRRIGRADLIGKLYDKQGFKGKVNYDDRAVGSTYETSKAHKPKKSNKAHKADKPKSFNPNFYRKRK